MLHVVSLSACLVGLFVCMLEAGYEVVFCLMRMEGCVGYGLFVGVVMCRSGVCSGCFLVLIVVVGVCRCLVLTLTLALTLSLTLTLTLTYPIPNPNPNLNPNHNPNPNPRSRLGSIAIQRPSPHRSLRLRWPHHQPRPWAPLQTRSNPKAGRTRIPRHLPPRRPPAGA